jgi:hypothetical protein
MVLVFYECLFIYVHMYAEIVLSLFSLCVCVNTVPRRLVLYVCLFIYIYAYADVVSRRPVCARVLHNNTHSCLHKLMY